MDRRVHYFVHNTFSQRLDDHFLIGRQRPQAPTHAVNLRLANGFQVVMQRNNGGNDVQRLQAFLEALDLHINNRFGARGFFSAVGNVGNDRLLQIVNVVNENSIELIQFRINVSRHRDINEEHGTVLPPTQEQLSVFSPEDGMRSPGRRNDNISAVAGFVKLRELDGLAV